MNKKKKKDGIGYLISFPIIKQLQTLFARPNFWTHLNDRFNRRKENEDGVKDVNDVELYKDQSRTGLLRTI